MKHTTAIQKELQAQYPRRNVVFEGAQSIEQSANCIIEEIKGHTIFKQFVSGSRKGDKPLLYWGWINPPRPERGGSAGPFGGPMAGAINRGEI